MSKGEDRVMTFLFTAISVGCLTEAITRTISLMRFTPSAVICLVVGLLSLAFLLMQMGLAEG